jgi:hypothetical protein
MDYFAGLDVSVKDTSLCIVDGTGKIVREVDPDRVLTAAPLWALSGHPRVLKRTSLDGERMSPCDPKATSHRRRD